MLTTKTAMESYYIIYLFFSILAVKVNLPALVLVYKSIASKNSNYVLSNNSFRYFSFFWSSTIH